VDLAEHIFGPDVGTVKGKMTRRKPLPIIDEHIEIPEELISVQEDITLAIDGITINSLKFLSTIEPCIICQPPKQRTTKPTSWMFAVFIAAVQFFTTPAGVGSMCHTIERTDRQGYPNC
jgi:hypothetical protein